MQFRSRSSAETREAGRCLGASIDAVAETRRVGFAVGLAGSLGAGKTEFVKGLARGLGVDEAMVASPTFVIASEYSGRRRLAHVDFYRLESEGELELAGFVDLLDPGQIVAIEWSDRFPAALPADRVDVRIARGAAAPESLREIELRALGPIAERVVRRFADELKIEEERAPWR